VQSFSPLNNFRMSPGFAVLAMPPFSVLYGIGFLIR